MPESILTERVEQLFASALAQTYQREGLSDLHNALQQSWRRLKQPMRVAIIGLSKAGKSTIINAMLGESVVATGITFNVNWLRYAPEASLLVHFKDERAPERKDLTDLEQLTRSAAENCDYLLDIKYIEVFHPNVLLQAFSLIDTPGLASFYTDDDSQNTSEFLKLHRQELTEATQREAAQADAVLYLFSHSPETEGKAVAELFQSSQIGQITPINSIGILTKMDTFWPSHQYPLAVGKQIIETLQTDHPRLRNIFHTIAPLCGSLAWGAQTLTADEFVTLQQIARLPEARLEKLLADIDRFAGCEYQDVPITPAEREAVLDRLGAYGIWRAYHLLRSGISKREDLEQALLQDSGLPALKQLILSHFGNRASLIKLSSALQQIKSACFWAQNNKRISPAEQEVVRQIENRFGRLEDQERGLSELTVLRDYYQEKLDLTEEEVEHLLQITGEHGLSLRRRVGLPEKDGELDQTDWQEILHSVDKRRSYWRRRVVDPGVSNEMIRAAGILGDAYEHISYQAMEQLKQY